jgi:5'-nucleotidase
VGIPQGIVINVNFPACRPEEVRGLAVTAQGRRDAQTVTVEERADGRGKPYYWISVARGESTPGLGTDLAAMAENKISVTPLKLDLTSEQELTRFASILR